MSGHPDAGELQRQLRELREQAAENRREWAELARSLGVEASADELSDSAAQAETDERVRLVALDMLLSGRSREEIRSYLQETFVHDPGRLVDDVFDEFGQA